MPKRLSTLNIDSIRLTWKDDDQLTDSGEPMLGIYAEATVSYSIGNGSRRLETLSSGGLWSIDPSSTQAYMHEIELDELADLRSHIANFGIIVSAVEWKRLTDAAFAKSRFSA